MNIAALLTAITSHFETSDQAADFRAALTGGLYYDEADSDASEPYGVYFIVSGDDQGLTRDQVADVLLQVDVYAASLPEAANLLKLCNAAFSGATISGNGLRATTLVPGNFYGPTKADDSWQATLEISCPVQDE